jgi:hypothetical protein
MNNKPIQTLSFAEKIANDNKWGKANVDYLCDIAMVNDVPSDGVTIEQLYDVYNGRFPAAWFKSVTDPLSAEDPNNTYYPAKIRPVTILRTNLDLIQGEFIKRPFPFQVQNLSPDAYFAYEEERLKALKDNLISHFNNAKIQELINQGIEPEEAQAQVEEVGPPEEMMEKFPYDYRDYIAQMGKDWLDCTMAENKIWEVWKTMFKDWTISGHTFSFKSVFHSQLIYWRVSPRNIKYEKEGVSPYIEDREWVVADYEMSLSELVDLFYDKLSVADIKALESNNVFNRSQFISFLQMANTKSQLGGDKYVVKHAVWKSKKRLLDVMSTDPVTGMPVREIHDEDYIVGEGEKAEPFYVNEFWEGWRISEDIYVNIRPIEAQRNEMNNLSYCKGPYNGKVFSNTESEFTSILKLGIPIQILYLIVQYKLEEAIAQNMGKIVLIDKNVIPKGDGWNEEKFFYTAKAKRFMVINRNQMGADRSFNQYQTLDMDTFQNISQLIDLLNALEEKWDNLIGISRQRKAQVQASDSVSGTNQAIFQSSVITEIVFDGFKDFLLSELQGLLDLSKLTNTEGMRKLWHTSDMKAKLLEIDPDLYCNASMGVFATDTAGDTDKLNRIKQYLQAFAQNGMDPHALVSLELADSISELKQMSKQYTETAKKMAEQNAKSEQEAEQAKIQLERDNAAYLKSLDLDYMHQEYDRKERLAVIEADASATASPTIVPDTSGDDMKSVRDSDIKTKELVEQQRGTNIDASLRSRELDIKEKEIEAKERIEERKAKVALRNKVSGEK